MREQFNAQLVGLRQELVSIYADLDLQLHDAVDALTQHDRKKAKAVKEATRQIDERCAKLETDAYNLIVLQQPVASDLRLIQFIIYVNFNLSRISNHVRNIAKTAKRCAKLNVPGQLLDLLASQAHLVYRVMGATLQSIVEADLSMATSLPELDAPVDAIYKQFYRAFAKLGPNDDIDAATRVVMSSRMLERISDNCIEMGERLTFLITGRHRPLDQLATLKTEQLESMIKARGEGMQHGITSDLETANRVPELKLSAAIAARKAAKAARMAGQATPKTGSVTGEAPADGGK